MWSCCAPRRLIYPFERTKYQLKSLNIPQVIRDLHEQHEQPAKYQLFSFKTHFKFILQNHLGIYATCIPLSETLFLVRRVARIGEHRDKYFQQKSYLKRVNMYLTFSGLYSHRVCLVCIMEISWWIISIYTVWGGKKILNHSQNRDDLCVDLPSSTGKCPSSCFFWSSLGVVQLTLTNCTKCCHWLALTTCNHATLQPQNQGFPLFHISHFSKWTLTTHNSHFWSRVCKLSSLPTAFRCLFYWCDIYTSICACVCQYGDTGQRNLSLPL